MSFFEQMGKKISDVSQGVVQQTKNFSDTARINNAISEKKKAMSKLMWEMGQDYYIKHKKDVSCEEQEYIDQVNALFREVLQLQKELEQIKAMATCRSCGAPLPDGTLFCTNCGTPVANEQEEADDDEDSDGNARRCPACGEEIDDDSCFCCYCGKDLRDDEQEDDCEDDIRRCPSCGEEIEEDSTFCCYCGEDLRNT